MDTPEKDQVILRGGSRALVYNWDAGGERPIHGAYWSGEDWQPITWFSTGRWHEDRFTGLDILINTTDEPACA